MTRLCVSPLCHHVSNSPIFTRHHHHSPPTTPPMCSYATVRWFLIDKENGNRHRKAFCQKTLFPMGQNEVGSDSGARKCVDVLQKTTFPKNRESENGNDFAQNCKGEAKSSPTNGSSGDGNILFRGSNDGRKSFWPCLGLI